MPKVEKGSSKWLGIKMKHKGLQKLKWYCQICEKQCRDENGYKCHRLSELHLRQMQVLVQNPDKYIDDYSRNFHSNFMRFLTTRYRSKTVLINVIYMDLIQDREHVHMNGTRWHTLSNYAEYLHEIGVAEIERSDRGYAIRYIDRERQLRENLHLETLKEEIEESNLQERALEKRVKIMKSNGMVEKSTTVESLGCGIFNEFRIKNNYQGGNFASNNHRRSQKTGDEISLVFEDETLIDDKTEIFKNESENYVIVKSEDTKSFVDARTRKNMEGGARGRLWAHVGLVVKCVRSGKKGVIEKVSKHESGVVLFRVNDKKTGSSFLASQEELRPVIPANGRPVIVVSGDSAGIIGVMQKLHTDDTGISCQVLLNNEERQFPPECICKFDYESNT